MRRSRAALDVVFSGGGTGGHLEPALALARALVERGHPPERLHFVGGRSGMEERRLADSGFSLTVLPGRGVVRRPSPANLLAIAGLLLATAQALGLLLRRRPGVVVGLGGYASLPAALGAVVLRIPLVVVNLDARPGAANRLVGRFAVLCTISFPGVAMPHAVLTGTPLRPEVLAASRDAATSTANRELLGISEGRQVVVVVGGSLGAGRLNEAALGLAHVGAARADLVVYHVTGVRNYDRVAAEAARLGLEEAAIEYHLVGFSEHLPELFALCALAVSRAGANSVAELAAIGTPSVLVPLPNAPRDHQRHNTEELAAVGGAVVLSDAEATGERLGAIVLGLLDEPGRLAEMAAAARSVGRRDAAGEIARRVDALIRGGRGAADAGVRR